MFVICGVLYFTQRQQVVPTVVICGVLLVFDAASVGCTERCLMLIDTTQINWVFVI
jgi:hypothetical protein